MDALASIRKRGAWLIGIIGLGLFAFIAEEMFRSCEATSNEKRQQVGEVLGEKINVQDFQALIEEYEQVIKFTQGRDNLTEEELNRVKDQVWDTYVNNAIIADEAAKLGLTVTDEELQNILREGTNQMLLSTPFVNQQTGRFDATVLTKFLDDYKKSQTTAENPEMTEQYKKIYDYWKFIEKTLRQNTLAMKYQQLLFGGCLISNPISAKMAFEGQTVESDITLASIAYNTIADNKVEVSEADIKAKYAEKKEMFKQYVETRDIKYVDVQILPSAADRKALAATMQKAYDELVAGGDPAQAVRKAQSAISYAGIAQTKKAFPQDIAARLDSMAVGQTTKPFENAADNTLNIIKLIAKTSAADSIEYRVIQSASKEQADSIVNAIAKGGDFEQVAKGLKQEGQKQWITSAMYEGATTMDDNNKAFLAALTGNAIGEVKTLDMGGAQVIIQVTDRKANVDKYTAAVVKHTIDFSKGTYSEKYNKFSQYVSESQNLEQLEKNAAKYGFRVQERQDMMNTEHYVAGIRSTRDAMKWIFEAKEGDLSPLYECGNNDHLLVLAMTKIHPVGYREVEDKNVSEMLKAEVLRDKKFEQIAKTLDGVKDPAQAKAKGANVGNVAQITFAAPAFVQATGASEPALSGAVAAVKQGQVSKVVKGNAGVYLFKVNKKAQRAGAKFDAKTQEQMLAQQYMQAASRFMNELYTNSGVVDHRYLFF